MKQIKQFFSDVENLTLMLNRNTFKTLFFHPLLVSGISLMVIFEIQYRLVLLKDKSLNLLDKVLIVRLMLIILTRLRVGLSHLREHIFRHNLPDSLDPFCKCGRHIETIIYFFLFTAQITQVKEKPFPIKLVTSNAFFTPKWFNYSRNINFWIERSQWQRECIDNCISQGRFISEI